MGLIQSFEFAFELAWNLMKDYLRYNGITDIIGSRDAIRVALKQGIIENGEIWMDMIERRNETARAYDEEVAVRVINIVSGSCMEEMRKLLEVMKAYQLRELTEE